MISFVTDVGWWFIHDENEIIPLQKFPWNALCKNGILLKIHLFSKPNLKTTFFNQTPQHHHFCTFNSPFMFQKSLGYAIKTSKDSTESQKKIVIFKKKLKITKFESWTWAEIVFSKKMLIKYFDSLCKYSKRNRVSTLLSSELHCLSIGHGLTLSPMENYLVFLEIFWAVYMEHIKHIIVWNHKAYRLYFVCNIT